MSTTVRTKNLRREAKRLIDALEPETLWMAVKFLAFLEDQDAEAATEELLEMPGLLKRVEQAEKDITAGRGSSWRGIRRDV